MSNVNTRQNDLNTWVMQILKQFDIAVEPASEDASFRRYFRIHTNNAQYIAMDAPPDKEPINSFLKAANALSKTGMHVPEIHASDVAQGFILMEDLGKTSYLDELTRARHHQDTLCIDGLYQDAIDSLIQIQQQTVSEAGFFAHYDADKLDDELTIFIDWYLARHLTISLNESEQDVWSNTKNTLISACLEQPQVWVHRDFHSRNLMVTQHANPGVIDFQDMVVGPIAYDLASIFKDCYIDWPRAQQLHWLNDYLTKSEYNSQIELQQLIRWYDLTGLQRHLKVLGIFCRLNYRDDKTHYLNDLPLVRKYIVEVLSLYPELSEFQAYFNQLAHR